MVGYIALSLLAAFVVATNAVSVRPSQSIGVRGQLKCKGRPASGVLVKLYDHDTFTIDDKIAQGRTDGQGYFEISGTANEVSRITPKFNIYHDCDDWKPCQRKVSIYVPKSFISRSSHASKIYDAGVLELSGKFPGEGRDCLH
ncbi:CRE-TTR-8 protein [Aphelenchoides avenae]|nr:CRE-TTR-8 protein [Aphelenchus avenae]